MYNEPYQTSVLRGYPVKKLLEQLETQYIDGALAPVVLGKHERAEQPNADSVVEILPGNTAIDLLEAPLLIETRQGRKVAIDSRATKRAGRHHEPAVIASPADYRFAVREAILTYLWATEGAVGFSQLGELPIRVYARWVSEGISRKLGLDPMDHLRLQVLSAYYYVSSFLSDGASPQRLVGMASLIGRALRIPMDKILPFITEAGTLTDAASLIHAFKTGHEASPRLEALNVGLLYTLLNPSWYGARKSIIVAVAVEYPPTFLTMLLSAYTERGYHSSYFTKTALSAAKNNQARDFVLALNHVSRGLTDE